MLKRLHTQLMIRPEDLKPSREDMEIIGVFNPGAVRVGDRVALLVRVAERPTEQREGYRPLMGWDPGRDLRITWIEADKVIDRDPRVVTLRATHKDRLTFISHLRVLWSSDGRTLDSPDDTARLCPQRFTETFGVEDPRITPIGDRFYITYVAVSPSGTATALASTTDFTSFHYHGIIFCSDNKDVMLFPERIDGHFAALHRPTGGTNFSSPEMWIARSPDLLHWGSHQPFRTTASDWSIGRIGGGCPPLRTERGWLVIYHGNDKKPTDKAIGSYFGAAMLLDLDNPHEILAQLPEPILAPEEVWEREGFVPNVIFPTGIVERDERYQIYYGAADTYVGMLELDKSELLARFA